MVTYVVLILFFLLLANFSHWKKPGKDGYYTAYDRSIPVFSLSQTSQLETISKWRALIFKAMYLLISRRPILVFLNNY